MLLDPGLAGIDPHDTMLSREMKARVLRECQFNYWYFIREVIRVPETGKSTGVRYKLHRGNLALSFCLLLNLNIFFELPRQQGKSIAAIIWYLYVYNFATANAEITFLNKAMKDSKLNLSRLRDIRDALPSYLQMSQEFSIGGKKKKMPSTVETLQHPINNNIIKTAPSARNETSAANLLRGRTITCLWADEWGFVPYNDIIYTNTAPALSTAFINAKTANSPYGTLVTTTPGVLSCREGLYAYNMKHDATDFSEGWYDKSPLQIEAMVHANRLSDFVYVKFDYKQVGRSEEWFADLVKKMGVNKMRDIRREILLEWSDSPENCPFDDIDLEEITRRVHPPISEEEILPGQYLKIYEKIVLRRDLVPKYPPIIGVDVSGGYSRDASAVTVIDSKTTKVIADFSCNYISPIDLARFVMGVTLKFYPNAIINIERNGGFGAAVIAKLKESKVKKNLYFEIKDRVIEETTDGLRVVRKKQKTKVYGLDSTKEARMNLIDTLRQRVAMHKDKFISPKILEEMKGMQVKRDGKIEHSANTHDDQVFSYLMALYVWYDGKHLKEFFNIEKTTIYTETNTDDKITDLDEQFTSVIEEVEPVTAQDNTIREEVTEQLKLMQKAKGITYQEYIKQEQEYDENVLKDMLRNKVVLSAYAKANGFDEEEVKDRFLEGETNIPDSVFTSFCDDVELSEDNRLKKNFNFIDFPTDG